MESTNFNISPNNWFVGARSKELKHGAILRRLILGKPYALFRDVRGDVQGLEDSCPHKNLPLSMGKVVGSEVQCRYHGWRFNAEGACTDVPCHAPNEKLPVCKIPSFHVVEQDGFIWVHPTEPRGSSARPPSYPRDPKFGRLEFLNITNAPVDLFIENGIDCVHTSTVHKGLFDFPRQLVRAMVRRTSTGVRIDTLNEQTDGSTKKFHSPLGKKKITSYDEVILPHTVRQTFSSDDGLQLITVHLCTPEDGDVIRVYSHMSVYYGRLTTFATWYVKHLAEKVIAEDKEILEGQAENIRRFGQRNFRTVTADLPMNWAQRAIRQFNEGKFESQGESREITYRL
ncbi:aromatic ring-hydroxylating dioxygenase subunit alpha [Pendulispora rubella]|uniref:Aromatic ring-hydroxylating dioxygenase subunit alpha n=1 Tax=Pendulispora rubella TaxID=2741070 RepID=A0ABZ2KWT3_9BACT